MKCIETEHQFRGYEADADGGICRIEVYTADECPPLVVATELPKNPVASITNMAEYLAAEVMERYLTPTQLLGHQPPLLWIEHYERTAADRRTGLTESWEQITFAHYGVASPNGKNRTLRPKRPLERRSRASGKGLP